MSIDISKTANYLNVPKDTVEQAINSGCTTLEDIKKYLNIQATSSRWRTDVDYRSKLDEGTAFWLARFDRWWAGEGTTDGTEESSELYNSKYSAKADVMNRCELASFDETNFSQTSHNVTPELILMAKEAIENHPVKATLPRSVPNRVRKNKK